jgi:hypothetical protein
VSKHRINANPVNILTSKDAALLFQDRLLSSLHKAVAYTRKPPVDPHKCHRGAPIVILQGSEYIPKHRDDG